ncbi:hypothetical protein [Vibrio agarivorans]|uniref:Uncharacterized protein n=1 Tax=Vibrio agarivorans TaxID=153622 RepID=A0ABT7XZW7_9VIBR|nr:hypothetical protein [Vibrio agarivorans]MDN2481331.1 hypothetical protein [Vibrio agarivorans]
MLLEQILEVIEFTDSDLLEDAMSQCNKEGVVSSELFPFLNCVFEQAPNELCARLSRLGFKGQLTVEKVESKSGVQFQIVDNLRQGINQATTTTEQPA